MNRILFVLYCIEILGAVLYGAADSSTSLKSSTANPNHNHSTSPTPDPQDAIASTNPTATTTTAPLPSHYIEECLPLVMVAGGLIIACTILLISTLLLMCKVCQLSKQVKLQSDNADQISTCEYWPGTAKKSESVSAREVGVSTVLMVDIVQTQEEVGNGATKGEAVKEKKDGQTEEEEKEKVADTATDKEASTAPETTAGDAPSSKPPEEATDLPSVKA